MSRALKLLMFIYAVVFLTTGVFMVLIVNADESSQPWITLLVRNHAIVYAWHLVCWMILGMFTNYYWDLFNMGKGMESMQALRIVLPLLVSPFVFMPTYNLWLASSSQSYMLFAVIAIQSGFFWQALLAKVAPLDRPATIPWSVNNTGRNGRAPTSTPQGPELGR
jgi:hypothetical protein